MSRDLSGVTPAPKLLGPIAARMRLMAASVAVLVVGGALAPPREDRAPSRTEERANPLIEEQVAAVSAPIQVDVFSSVQEAARLVRGHVIEVRADRPSGPVETVSDVPGRTSLLDGAGVVVSDGHVLTHATALGGRTSVRVATADGGVTDAALVAFDPPTGLALLRISSGVATAAVLASATPAAGSVAVAVGHAGGHPLTQPTFVTVAEPGRVLVTPAGPGTAPGLPVFTLAGTLVGVMGASGTGEVVPASGLVERLIASAAAGDMPRSFGLTLQRLDGGLTRVFGERGVLVSDVVPDGPAAQAGLSAGDVILAVGDTVVTSPDAVRDALTAPVPATTLRVLQRRRERAVDVAPVSSYAVAHLAHLAAVRGGAALAGAVLPPPVLAALGLPSDTHVLSVNGVTATTRPAADRALATPREVDVLHVRESRGARFVAMERAR